MGDTIMTRASLLIAAAVLSACSGARTGPVETISASGPVRSACLDGGRSAASPELCGCVQAVADARFSSSEQRRITRFFAEPHLTQEMRQSDKPSDEAFWLRWKAFGAESEQVCRAAV